MAPRLHATYMSILETLKMRKLSVTYRTDIGRKRSSGRIFQHITKIFWLPKLFTLLQLFDLIKKIVS